MPSPNPPLPSQSTHGEDYLLQDTVFPEVMAAPRDQYDHPQLAHVQPDCVSTQYETGNEWREADISSASEADLDRLTPLSSSPLGSACTRVPVTTLQVRETHGYSEPSEATVKGEPSGKVEPPKNKEPSQNKEGSQNQRPLFQWVGSNEDFYIFPSKQGSLIPGVIVPRKAKTSPLPPQSIEEVVNLDKLLYAVAFAVPQPGETYMIGSSVRGLVLTLLDGKPILDTIGGHGHQLWTCFETKGWLGLRNPAAGRCLGHKWEAKVYKLECRVPHHTGREYLVFQPVPEGGYIIQMIVGSTYDLRTLGSRNEDGVETVFLLDVNTAEEPIIWNFIKYDA